MTYDYAIIGCGIVGLATAMAILEKEAGASIILLDKEADVAAHQTGHNSGVIHAGVYYAPGSLKARLCREGAAATKAFCAANGVPFEECGKLIVATDARELERMVALQARAGENGIAVERMTKAELAAAEPAISGSSALHVAATGIVDYRAVCRAMAVLLHQLGAEISFGAEVVGITESNDAVTIDTPGRNIRCRALVACAGLQSDRVARLAGLAIDYRVVPFRGEYYALPESKSGLVRHLIYPVPDPALPFLGIHLTRMMAGGITVGPNAVLGLSREGYRRWSVSPRDVADMAGFAGLWRLVRANLRSGIAELHNALSKSAYLAACRKYCPELRLEDLRPYPAGIRAQAVTRSGELIHDFLFARSPRMVHVCNAPSPAATSAIPIGRMIAEDVITRRPPR